MYESHYGFNEKPFSLTPDPKYLYLSRRHTEAFAHLEFGHRERGGFVVVTGEVGTGKTTLARSFLARLGPQTATAVVLYPALSASELLRTIVQELHVADPGPSLKDLVDALHRFLLQARRDGRDVVLLIDEAQDLSPEVLEQVRLLSNLETDTDKLIQIVLMGQSELNGMLGRHELRQLAQRVTARYHLSALSEDETAEYVRHRLSVAGGAGRVGFTRPALRAVHRVSGGVPRLVNLVCDRALLGGYVRGAREIDAALVRAAAREALHHHRAWPARWQAWSARLRPALLPAAGVLGVAVLATAGFALLDPAGPSAGGADTATARAAGAAGEPARPAATPRAASSLDPVLLSLPRVASLEGALGAVRERWGAGALEQVSFRTHFEQLRRLDTPLVLEMFHPARRDSCYLALLRLDRDEAVVSAGAGLLRVPVADVDRLWTRQAIFLWRDFDGLARSPQAALAAPFTRETLARLGYTAPDGNLPSAVARFQADFDLVPDGLVGSRTLMMLYSVGRRGGPRLQGGLS